MKVRIQKLHENAVIPKYETLGSAGMDLTAVDVSNHLYYTEYDTGLAIEIPMGYVGLVFPRSSISKLPGVSLSNAVGVIDSDYRGSIKCRFRGSEYNVGDRIAQLVVMPFEPIRFELTNLLTNTVRGADGFGSTGQ